MRADIKNLLAMSEIGNATKLGCSETHGINDIKSRIRLKAVSRLHWSSTSPLTGRARTDPKLRSSCSTKVLTCCDPLFWCAFKLALGKPKEGIPEGRKKLDEGSAFDPG
jgi:hypothetical protein